MIRIVAFAAAGVLLGYSSIAQAAPPSCQITFRLGTSTPLFSASVFVIYQDAPGEFAGSSVDVDCDLLNGTVGQTADADQTRTLTVTMAGTPSPIQGPKDVARCTWIPTSRFPVAGDFNLSGQSGFNTMFQQVNANITIDDIDCSGTIATTTTTSTSTTTLPLVLCGDFDGNGVLQTSDALNVLRAAVGQQGCDLCVCDIDGNGSKGAADALVALKAAVGILIEFGCPICD